MIQNPVIVMALYDIGRDSWNSFNLSYNTYLSWMKNTLSLDAKVVVYTEKKFIEQITAYRKEFDPNLLNTIIIEQPLEHLKCYELYNDKLSALMFSDSFKHKIQTQVPEMTKPLYNIVMFNKLRFLQDVKHKNYFDNDLLIWADAGGLRESMHHYKNEVWPDLKKINQLDNTKPTFFSHSKNISVRDKEFHALSQIRYIQGTAFIVPSNLIDDLVKDFEESVDDCLANNYIGSDEKIFDITYVKNPKKYNLIKCGWRQYFDILKKNSPSIIAINEERGSKIFIDLGSYECGSVRQKIDELDIDPSWTIHAFEPNPKIDTYKFADEMQAYYINVHKAAAWDRNGRVILNQYGNTGISQGALVEETGGGKSYADYYDSCIVKAIDLHEFISSLDSGKEIYINMDIEYAEYRVIDHMINAGWPKNIKKIWIEWHDINSGNNKQVAYALESKIKSSGTQIESRMI